MLCYRQKWRYMWSISDKLLEEETMMRVWEQNNYRQSPILWFQARVNLGAANWLVTRLESRCESARCEKRAVWYLEIFPLTCPLQTWLTAIRRCCKQLLNLISCRKWFCPLNGRVTNNRTLVVPPLSSQKAVKSQTSMYNIFVSICVFSDEAYFLICRRLIVPCTWVYFLSFVVHAIT